MKFNEFFSNLTDLELWENSMQLLNGLEMKSFVLRTSMECTEVNC
jgi:hypothetical protein